MAGKRMKNMENIISNKLVNISISLEDYIPLKVLINLSSRKFVVLHYSALWGIVGGHCTLKAL